MKMNNHLFSEVYGCYFTMVKRILEQAEIGFTRSEMEAMVQADGFYDTAFHLLPKLFSEEIETLKEIPPLFLQSDFHLYDSAADGDPYEKKHYINIFLTILKTCTNQTPLSIHYKSGKQNLARILYAEYSSAKIEKKFNISKFFRETVCKEPIMLEISKERNGLERCMLEFASWEKHTEYDEERDCYICRIYYDGEGKFELLVRVLSFGPVVRILGPMRFLEQVKERVRRQYGLNHPEI